MKVHNPSWSFLLAIFLCLSCAGQGRYGAAARHGKESAFAIPSVPFSKQGPGQCGAAALASVLAYYGVNISQAEISREAFSPALRGTLIFDLERVARGFGFECRVFSGGLTDIRERIRRCQPVIILVDEGISVYHRPHFLVVTGFNDEKEMVVAHTGDQPDCFRSYEKLEVCWSKMNYLSLVVTPPRKTRE